MHSSAVHTPSILLATLLFACSGRVVVGIDRGATGGAGGKSSESGGMSSGGSAGGPSSGGAATTGGGELGGSGGIPSVGGTGGMLEQGGTAGEGGVTTPPRWLAVGTMFSSASSRAAVSFQNLDDPSSQLTAHESEAGRQCPFSPDGRYACFVRLIGSTNMEVFLLDAATSELGVPRSIGFVSQTAGLTWSPDSKRFLCVDTLTGAPELLYVEPSSGTRVSLGSSQGNPTFARDGSLFFTNSEGALVRVEWDLDGAAHATATGITGSLGQVSTARDVAVLAPPDSEADAPDELLNLQTLAHAPLPRFGTWRLSPSFRTLVSIDVGSSEEMGSLPSTISYYRVQDLNAELVATEARSLSLDEFHGMAKVWLKYAGERFVELRGAHVFLTSVEASGVTRWELDGEYQKVSSSDWSPDGRWGTVAGQNPDSSPAGTFHWLFRVEDTGPRAITKIGPFGAASNAYFSPDSSKLALMGYDGNSATTTAQPSLLVTFDGDGARTRDLALPYNWSGGVWSSDSSHIAFIGGAFGLRSRPLYVVDANDALAPNRLIVSCDSNPAADPGCPMDVAFQH